MSLRRCAKPLSGLMPSVGGWMGERGGSAAKERAATMAAARDEDRQGNGAVVAWSRDEGGAALVGCRADAFRRALLGVREMGIGGACAVARPSKSTRSRSRSSSSSALRGASKLESQHSRPHTPPPSSMPPLVCRSPVRGRRLSMAPADRCSAARAFCSPSRRGTPRP